MKKLNYLILGAAGLLLASCSQEEVAPPAAGDGYTVSVKLPTDLGTRAYGEGYTARDLLYAVYEVDQAGTPVSGNPIITNEATFPKGELETEVSFNLANGKYYAVAFFAESYWAHEAGKEVYNFNPTTGKITINYANMTSANNNVDAYDCFYKLHMTGLVGDAATNNSPTVILTRPVAQINWGTSDYDEATVTDANAFGDTPITDLQSTFTALKAYTTFDFFTSDVEGTPVEITIGADPNQFAVPNEEAFPVSGYDYVAMQYVFAPKAENVYDLNLNIESSTTNHSLAVAVDNAPVQANYRTNIYGALLTDTYNVHVVKDPIWEQPDYDIDLTTWDGTTATTPQKVDGQYVITKASDLAGLAGMVSGGNDLSGETIVLTSDFDMGGKTFAGIGEATRSSKTADGNAFRGVFDGQGHTISNVSLSYSGSDADAAVGFFPNVDGEDAEVKNVTFNNVQIKGGASEQASIVGLLTGGATISNVTVASGNISATEAAAGIVGRVMGAGTVSDCTNNADIVVTGTGSGNAGGIAGAAYYTSSEITISNCTNKGNVTVSGAGANPGTTGGIVGTCGANVVECYNYGNVSTTGTTAGGIVGYQNSCGSIKDCINYGDVKGGAQVGGICGWIGNIKYDVENQIEITGNTNNGSLTATGQAAGIMAINRNNCYMDGNTNNAPAITAGSAAAGIVSGGYSDGNVYITLGTNTNTTPLDKMTATKTSLLYIGTFKVNNEVVTYN